MAWKVENDYFQSCINLDAKSDILMYDIMGITHIKIKYLDLSNCLLLWINLEIELKRKKKAYEL